jgi:TolB-like protein
VRVYRVRDTASKGPSAQAQPAPPLPDKPSIAVLPFANMSGDSEQEYFVDGMVEEIITALSQIPWLFVIARNSTLPYKERAVDVKQVGRELGVRYVLEGSVRKAGTQVRITGQLIDALTGTHLWANRFDGSLEDIFELQDRVAVSVAGVIEPALLAAEMRRSAARPTTDLSAYDLYLRARGALYPITRERTLDALGLLSRRSLSIGITGRRFLGRRSVICTSSETAGPKSRRHPAARPAISLGRRSRRGRTTWESLSTPALCWRISARTSVR